MMRIEVVVLDKRVQEFENDISNKACRLAGFLRKPPHQMSSIKRRTQNSLWCGGKKCVIEVYLTAGRQMRALNKKFLKKDRDTNVISLVMPKDFSGSVAGEVYLNPLFIKKNGQDFDLMLTHGVLHILGYDHVKKNDRIKMEKKEKQLLLKLAASR